MSSPDIFEDRLSNKAFEISVLVAVMTIAEIAEQANELSVDLFAFAPHQTLVGIFHKLHAEGRAIDAMTTCEKLKDMGLDVDGKMENYVMSIYTESSGTLFNYHSYVKQLQELSTRRQLRDACERGKIIANDLTQGDADSAIAKVGLLMNEVNTIGSGQDKLEPIIDPIIDLLHEVNQIQEEKMDDRYVVRGVNTGFVALDEKIGEVKNGDLIIIAARPSMGKTTLAQNIMNNIATNLGKPCLFESLEMKKKAISLRLISSVSDVPVKTIQFAKHLTGDDWNRMQNAGVILKEAPIVVHDKKVTLHDIRRHCRSMITRYGSLGAIFIDYLQLIKTPQFKEDSNEVARLTYISGGLKELAMEFDCPVFCLSQLNRSLETRANKRPIMSDLRGSGAIEQDADLIMMLYRDEIYNKPSKFNGVAEIIIGKHRDGEVGTTYVFAELDKCKFNDMAMGGIEHYMNVTKDEAGGMKWKS